VLIIAGGEAAISATVATDAAAACGGCTIDRRGGTGRDETAGILAEAPNDYGYTRPLLSSPGGSVQIVGDAYLGGTMNVDALTVQSTELVTNLNADQLDGFTASDFVRPPITVSGIGGFDSDDGNVIPSGNNGGWLWEVDGGAGDRYAQFGIESPRDANVSTGPFFPLTTTRDFGRLVSLSICFELADDDDYVDNVTVFSRDILVASSDFDAPGDDPRNSAGCYNTDLDVSDTALDTTAPLYVVLHLATDALSTNDLNWYGYSATFEPYTDSLIIFP